MPRVTSCSPAVRSPLPISISLIPPTSRSFVSASGADLSDALSTALQNLESAFIISGAGVGSAAHSGTINWEFSIDNALTQYLAADQSVDVTYRITVTDGSNITAGDEINVESEDVVITINGANDNPVLSVSSLDNSDTETLTETDAALTTSGTLTATDIDLANTASITHISVSRGDTTDGLISNDTELLNMLSVTPEQVLDGTQTINQFTWTFNSNPTANANSESFDYLANGETLTLTYRLTLSDQESGTTPDTHDIVITINGTNDDPQITGVVNTASVTGNRCCARRIRHPHRR